MAMDNAILHPNGILAFNRIGNATKKSNEGKTAQKMPFDNSTTFSILLVSKYSQHNANTEVSGMEAKMAATHDTRLPISDIAAIIIAEMKILIKNGMVSPVC